jgi:4-hydroxybenzoate polyprenyltransferase
VRRETTTELPGRSATKPLTWARAVRVHQWAKNLLLALPALAAHLSPTPDILASLALAFLSFSLLASSVYLVNDLADLEHDRAHPTKRDRPLAAGLITPVAAVVVAVVLALAALGLALLLPVQFLEVWLAYLVLTTLYSFGLKRLVVLDVMVLGALYTARVVAGAAAFQVPLSRWFLAFAVFFFSSLAIVKRVAESLGVADRRETHLGGRGWEVGDVPVLLGFGAACSVASALVYCLYITSDEVARLYGAPDMLWLGLPILLYWLGRVWLLTNRGLVHEDPLLFALRDRVSWLVLATLALTLWLAA